MSIFTVAHTGKNLANRTFELLEEFEIADRTLGHTADNASNNNTMLNELEKLYSAYKNLIAGRDTQVQCWGHVLNLIYHVGQSLCLLIFV